MHYYFLSDFSAQGANGSFQFTDTGFPGIVPDYLTKQGVAEFNLTCLQAILLSLSWNKIFLGYFQLFSFCISGKADNFHSV